MPDLPPFSFPALWTAIDLSQSGDSTEGPNWWFRPFASLGQRLTGTSDFDEGFDVVDLQIFDSQAEKNLLGDSLLAQSDREQIKSCLLFFSTSHLGRQHAAGRRRPSAGYVCRFNKLVSLGDDPPGVRNQTEDIQAIHGDG